MLDSTYNICTYRIYWLLSAYGLLSAWVLLSAYFSVVLEPALLSACVNKPLRAKQLSDGEAVCDGRGKKAILGPLDIVLLYL